MRIRTGGLLTAMVMVCSVLTGGAAWAGNAYVGMDVTVAEAGLQVSSVWTDSPAETAGLKAGDVITHIDNREVRTTADLDREIGRRAPGDIIVLKVRRDGSPRDVQVILGRESGRAGARGAATLIDKGDLTSNEAEIFIERDGYGFEVEDTANGVRVTNVREDGPAAGRLRTGDIIEEINAVRIRLVEELDREIARTPAGDAIDLRVNRDGTRIDTRVFGVRSDGQTGRSRGMMTDLAGTTAVMTVERLGIEVEDVAEGARVKTVVESGPSAGRLRAGDIIEEFEGTRINTRSDLDARLAEARDDADVLLLVARGAERVDVRVLVARMDGRTGGARGMADMLGETAQITLYRIGLDLEDVADGARVRTVNEEGPAAGRVRAGDIIVRIDDVAVRTRADVDREIAMRRSGDEVRLGLIRGAERPEARVVVARYSPDGRIGDARGSRARTRLGIDRLEPAERGLRIAEIRADGPAARAGLRVGDILVTFNEIEIISLDELTSQESRLQPGDTVVLRYDRDGQRHEARVSVDEGR